MSSTPAELVTPRSLGYSMPAEWARHRATWLAWPHNLETWPTDLEQVRDVWVQMISALSRHEQVYLLVNDESSKSEVAGRLKKTRTAMENVTLRQIPTVDVWMRDYGPTFVTRNSVDQPLAFNDWIFNGWGEKYRSYEDDDRVAREIARLLKVPVFDHTIVLEGGSIEVNGAGTCLTTVVCIVEANSKDENYGFLQDNYERLKNARDQNGEKLSIATLPCPNPVYYEGARLPASYANFYIANEVVLVPVFDDPKDAEALEILQDLFPKRKVIGLRCNEVVAGLGALHCVTQQEPAVNLSRG